MYKVKNALKTPCFDSTHPLFVNVFPLVEMGYERADSYAYIKEVWNYDMKASACNICPFHRNYFFKYLKENSSSDYESVIQVDSLLAEKTRLTPVRSNLYISRSRKRIVDLTVEECNDAEMFRYKDKLIWNGF